MGFDGSFSSGTGGGATPAVGNAGVQQDSYSAPPAADEDGFRTSTATSTSPATITVWNGVAGAGLTDPRSFIVVLAASAGAYALTAWTLTYEDVDGVQRTATATPTTADGGETILFKLAGTVVCGVVPVSLARPAQANNSGSFTLGFGDELGFKGGAPVTATGVAFPIILSFYVDGSVTAIESGLTAYAASNSPPNGYFLPTTPPDDAVSYDVVYMLTTE